jgi:hypothetical protein
MSTWACSSWRGHLQDKLVSGVKNKVHPPRMHAIVCQVVPSVVTWTQGAEVVAVAATLPLIARLAAQALVRFGTMSCVLLHWQDFGLKLGA